MKNYLIDPKAFAETLTAHIDRVGKGLSVEHEFNMKKHIETFLGTHEVAPGESKPATAKSKLP